MRRKLSRDEVLAWKDGWSYADKQLIEHCLDVLPETSYYAPASNAYVAALVDGRIALQLKPGYIEWPSAEMAALVDPARFPGGISHTDGYASRWYALSTFQHREEGAPGHEVEALPPCPVCWQQPAANGACAC